MKRSSDNDGNEFWSRFPDTEREFMSQVRDPGIYASVDFEFSPETRIKSEYRGVSASKLERLIKRWRDQGQIPEDMDREAVKSFQADAKAWDEEYEAAVDQARARLPAPPFGCHWVSNMGGTIMTRNAGGRSVPQRLSFRLWHDDLGYMPHSE